MHNIHGMTAGENFDKIFDSVGQGGRCQWFIWCLMGITYSILGLLLTSGNFVFKTPEFHCKTNNSIPVLGTTSCGQVKYDSCHEFIVDENGILTNETQTCQDGYSRGGS